MQKIKELLKDKKIKIMLIFVVVVIFIFILLAAMSKNNNNEPNQDELDYIPTNEELQQQLFKKVKELRYGDYCEIKSTNHIFNNDCLYRKERTTSKDLSEVYRIYTLALTLDDSDTNAIVGNIVVDGYSFPAGTKFIDLDKFKEGYNSLYGKTTSFNPLNANRLKVFPVVKYDEKRQKYYYQTEGSEEKPREDKTVEYLENIESDKHRVYLYVNVAFVSYEEDNTIKVYTDRSKQRLVDSYPKDNYPDEKFINDTNHAIFKEYKYTFYQESESNNLIFEQVELIV